ncbi:MAG: sugar ABC transporter substrate-binding protein [Chthoniobacterales bacterium]
MNVRTVAYVMCLPPGLHPGMDTVAHGIAAGLGSTADLRILPADLRDPHFTMAQLNAVSAATDANVDGIILFVLDEKEPAPAVWRAIGKNIPVIAFHKPAYEVTASVVVPNFSHGIYLTQFLARHLDDHPRVAIIGGPPILDDDEFVEGLVAGSHRCLFDLVNDPHDPACRNQADVKGGGLAAIDHVLDTCPDLDALIVFNDETLLDALPALDSRGLLGRLPVVCRNGSPAAVEAVRRGDLLATYDYGLPEIGLAAGQLLADLFTNGTDHEDTIVCPTPGRVLHEDNVDSYVPWDQRAASIPLTVGFE